MMDVLFLTDMLAQFKGAMSSAFAAVNGQVTAFLSVAVLFSWSLAVSFWVLEGCPGHHVPLIRKFMLIVAVTWLVQRLPELAVSLMEASANTGRGLVPGGVFDLSNPGEIAAFGQVAAEPLLIAIKAASGFPDIVRNIGEVLFLVIAWLTVLATFLIVALCVLFAWIEWGLLSAAVFVLLPLAVLGPTNFAAERAVGYVAATAVKFLVLGAIVTFTGFFLANIGFSNPTNPTFGETFGVLGVCLACLVAAIRAPSAAAGLVNGGPVLGGVEGIRTIVQAGKFAVSAAAVAGGVAVGVAGTAAGLAGRTASAARIPGGLALERLGHSARHTGANATRLGVGQSAVPAGTGRAPMSASQRRTLEGIAARTGRAYDHNMTHDQAAREIRRHLSQKQPAANASPPAEIVGVGRRAAGE